MLFRSIVLFSALTLGSISFGQTPGMILTVEFDKNPRLNHSEGLPSNTPLYRSHGGSRLSECLGTEPSTLPERFSQYLSFESCTQPTGEILFLNPMFFDSEHPNHAVPFSADANHKGLCKFLTQDTYVEVIDWTLYGHLSTNSDGVINSHNDKGVVYQYKSVPAVIIDKHGEYGGRTLTERESTAGTP